jgi:hypothetical protein
LLPLAAATERTTLIGAPFVPFRQGEYPIFTFGFVGYIQQTPLFNLAFRAVPDRSSVKTADRRSNCIPDFSQICRSPDLGEVGTYDPDAIQAVILTSLPGVLLKGRERFFKLLYELRGKSSELR